ncbi:MAG: alpha/beta fold hydrolase [Sphingomonas sp.]|nr:alpha/beta fold hydrolase [Sphingomonas sp.]
MRNLLVAAASAVALLFPSALYAQRPGTLISATPAAGAPAGMQVWSIHYWSPDEQGRMQDLTGMVAAPSGTAPRSARPVLAWTHGTWGVARQCAPSLSPSFFDSNPGTAPTTFTATPALDAVASGYVVVAPDYPGLGSAGVHPYLGGVPAARSTLDAIRAAQAIPGAMAGKRFALWGASQGGHAALWTAQLAASYAPELSLVGVAAAAPPTDLIANLRGGDDPSIRAFLTAFTAYSWSGYYGAPLASLGKQQTQMIITRLAQNNCVGIDSKPKLGAMIGMVMLRNRLTGVDLGTIQPWAGIARTNSVDPAAITVPMLVAQNPKDVIVSPAVTRTYARAACAAGKTVEWIDIVGKGHPTSAQDSAAATLQWISDRFAGKIAPSDCGSI